MSAIQAIVLDVVDRHEGAPTREAAGNRRATTIFSERRVGVEGRRRAVRECRDGEIL